MKTCFYFLLFGGAFASGQVNLSSFISGAIGSHSFAKAIACSENQVVCGEGSPFFNESGRVYFLDYNGSELSQNNFFQSPDLGDAFGGSVSVEGSYAAVGAASSDLAADAGGAVYLFRKIGGTWQFTATITAYDAHFNYIYGAKVKIFNNQLFVSSPYYSGGSMNGGKIYIYNLNDNQPVLSQEIIRNGGTSFGVLLVVGSDRLLTTYYQQNYFHIAIYSLSNNLWTEDSNIVLPQDYMPVCFKIENEKLYVGIRNVTTNYSSISIYDHDSGAWTYDSSIAISNGTFHLSQFDIKGNVLIAGVSYSQPESDEKSQCQIFYKDGDTWTPAETFEGDGLEGQADLFGDRIVFADNLILIGAPSEGTQSQGKLYYFDSSQLDNRSFEHSISVVYPNPTQDFIHILSNDEQSGSVDLYSLSGAHLFHSDNVPKIISLKQYSNGLYFLKLTSSEGEIKTMKVLKS